MHIWKYGLDIAKNIDVQDASIRNGINFPDFVIHKVYVGQLSFFKE